MDKRLRIVLELITRGFNQGARSASGVFKGFVSSITSGALNAARSLVDLSRTVFFVREALSTLAQVGRWVFDTFIRGAADVAKLEAKLKNITGSAENAERIIDLLNTTAAATGAEFDELAAGAGLMAVAAKDASGAFDFSKFQRLMDMLQRMAALRPDVPLDRLARGLSAAVQGDWSSLEMFLDVNLRQLLGIKDAADEVAKVPGEIAQGVTYIETKVDEAAQDALTSLDLLDEALTKAGATAGIVGDVAEKAGLERFLQILKQIATAVGEPIFEEFNKQLSELADWLEANPEKVEEFANILGGILAEGLATIGELLEEVDWDKLVDDILAMAQSLESLNIGKLAEDIQKFVDGVKAVEDFLNRIGGGESGAQTRQALEESGIGQAALPINEWIRQNMGAGLAQGGLAGGLAQAAAQAIKLEINVTSDNDMFNAKVRQISDDAVTDGMNVLAEELE